MPSHQTKFLLADLLKALGEAEKHVEVTRQVLAEKTAFEPYAAFKRIDRASNGYITTFDLIDFLRDNQLIVLEKEVKLLFKEQGSQREDRISYTEFLNILLPKTNSVLRQLATQRDSYPVARDEVLVYEVEYALTRVFEKELESNNKIELRRQDLAERYDYDALSLFKAVNVERLGSLDFDSIYDFLRVHDIPVIEAEVDAIIRRTDKDLDGRLTFSEFYSAIESQDPYYRVSRTSRTSRVASVTNTPFRNRSTPKVTESQRLSQSTRKLSNYDYVDYIHESAQKSARSRSPGLAATTSTYVERVSSPVRESLTKRIQESTKTDLSTSVYRTPVKQVASPSRARSPLRDTFSASRTPVRSSVKVREELSPMKGNEEEHLARALREQVEMDRELEDAKVELALMRDFNLLDAFKFFDIEGNGSITRKDLKDSLNELDVFPSSDELFLLMTRFNKSGTGLIKFSDFSEILTPKDVSYAEILNQRVPSYVDNEPLDAIFTHETIFQLKKTLKLVVKNEAYAETIRQRLNRRPLFNAWDGFKAIDKDNNGYIRGYQFKELLVDHGFFPSHAEVKSLVERYDGNQDGKVSYSEFIQEITPKSPQRY